MYCCNRCNSCNNGSSGVFTQYVPVTMAYNITPINTRETNSLSGNGSGLTASNFNGRTFYNWSGYNNSNSGCNC